VTDTSTLYAEHQQAVFRYLCRFVGQADSARDLTQEVFLRVSRTRVPDADAAGLRAWVFAIARNLALNHVRDRRPRETTFAHASAEPAVQELSVAIAQALDALDDTDRDAFLLREAGGLSYQEIAVACELTVEAVRTRLKRARQQLREALDGPVRVHRLRPISLRAGEPRKSRDGI
jgi:RNA polymerase sigma-70 factor (ECF subfamily)